MRKLSGPACKLLTLLAGLLPGVIGCSPGVGETGAVAEAVIEVEGGSMDRSGLIVGIDLPDRFAAGPVQILDEAGRLVPSQVVAGKPPRIYWRLPESFPAETRARYALHAGAQEASRAERVRIVDTGRSLQAQVGEAAVFDYRYETVGPPVELSPLLARNAYIHPVRSPAGAIVTGDFEAHGPHQRGIWHAWTRTEFQGRFPDFWNLHEGSGAVRFQAASEVYSGSVLAGFRVEHEHADLSAPDGPEPVLHESWDVTVFPYDSFFVFEIDSLQRPASAHPLNLPEYHYGGMAFRGRMEWAEKGARFLTSEWLTDLEADGTRARWCAVWGEDEVGASGLAILGHPQNFRAPQPLRIHTEYRYFAFAPQRLGATAIQPGRPYRSRFRFVVFDGPPDVELLERLWNDFADPAKVRIAETQRPDSGG